MKANKLYNHPFINENNQNGYFNVEAYDAIENLFNS
jgi:hypothetical protein